MKSLLIAGAPRSGTTLTYRAVEKSLKHQLSTGWKEPANLSGEIIAHVLLPDKTAPTGYCTKITKKFVEKNNGVLWKHAAIPWHIVKSLENKQHNVLYVHRNPADCIYACLQRNWIWPAIVLPLPDDVKDLYNRLENKSIPENEMLEILPWVADGIITIQHLYRSIADATVHWDHITDDPKSLFTSLEELGYNPYWHDYTSSEFRDYRKKQFARRNSALWDIAEKTVWMRGKIAEDRAKAYLNSL